MNEQQPVDAVDERGHPVDLSTLEDGEATVRVLRGTLRYPPDHIAIARAGRRLADWQTIVLGPYRSGVLTDRRRECLEGSP